MQPVRLDLATFSPFGKILSLWAIFSLFSIVQNFESTFIHFSAVGPIFMIVNWPNIEQIILPSGHTACNQMLIFGQTFERANTH